MSKNIMTAAQLRKLMSVDVSPTALKMAYEYNLMCVRNLRNDPEILRILNTEGVRLLDLANLCCLLEVRDANNLFEMWRQDVAPIS